MSVVQTDQSQVGVDTPPTGPVQYGEPSALPEPQTKQFVCEICQAEGKEMLFSTAQGLGRHKSSAHGIAGTARSTIQKRTRGSARSGSTRTARKPAPAAKFNPDKLVQALYPSGMPSSARVIVRLGGWLKEAEELAALGR